MFITEVSYHKICFIYTNARAVEGARGGSLARYINTSRKTAKHAPNLGKATCVLPENPYILHQKTMRIRDTSGTDSGYLLLPVILVAFAAYVTSLAANVASLATGLGAVTSDVARLVAVIAALHRETAGIIATLRAAARHVTSLVTIVTTQLRSLSTAIPVSNLFHMFGTFGCSMFNSNFAGVLTC
ncbi:hypothetical protein ALC56_13311 [Trachymyrmex septentrionalis]|uniref:Uncharacterized protein n=1 Tax=Trachymyrmex septentrionalis TaxID=34720 RepID=A0A195EX47_9HYME|nr:hypothetical protein ALC56_13311 [Trachymyrmex septentrionalis]